MGEISKTFLATGTHKGMRFDAALASLAPGLGLRARRRHIANGLATLNGKKAKPGARLDIGDSLELREAEIPEVPQARLLKVHGPWCFFFKPSGLHTAAIAGAATASLEAMLPQLLLKNNIKHSAVLLQRLDFATSGIVSAALNGAARASFEKMEERGQCHKYYLAVLSGILERRVVADYGLDTANRKKTKVLPSRSSRETCFQPLAIWNECGELRHLLPQAGISGGATLALCEISSGQRHQIRCHASAIGFPLIGDGLYGSGDPDKFILEHFFLEMPHCRILCSGHQSLLARLPEKGKKAVWAWLYRQGFKTEA